MFSSPSCSKCKLTYNALKKAGLPHEVVDVTVVEGARERALELSGGAMTLPIVVAPSGEVWSDFRRDKLKEYGA